MSVPKIETIEAWKALLTTSRLLIEKVEDSLAASSLPSLAWYDTLLEIEKAGKEGIRPYKLKERLLLPQYGTSRLLGRILTAGLIEKHDCDEDGRGFVVRITSRGRQLRRKMWRVYANALCTGLEGPLTVGELKLLVDLMQKTRPA